MSARHDVLDSLLPDVGASERADARRLVTYLRLLRDAARTQGAAPAEVDVRRAADECRRTERAADLAALATVFGAYVDAALPPDSFAVSGVASPRALDGAWLHIASARARGTKLLHFPDPSERAVLTAARAIDSARARGLFSGLVEVWEARLVRARDGIAAAERHFERIRSRARRSGRTALEAAAVQGLCEGHLDRFEPYGARELIERDPLLPASSPRLAWLAAWLRLLTDGDADDALGFARGLEPERAHLPPALAELREREPAWAALLPGEPARRPVHALWDDDRVYASVRRLRSAWGATLVAIFAVERWGARVHGVRCVEWDADHSIASRAGGALGARSDAWKRAGEPEHAMCAGQDERIEHGASSACLPASSRAVARIPIRSRASGVTVGWLHVESAHLLLPCAARRAIAARWWGDALGERGAHASVPAELARNESTELSAFVELLLARLPMRLTRRRAVVLSLPFETDIDRLREPRRGDRGILPARVVVGTSGGGFATLEPRLGGGVRRALGSGAVVSFSRHSSLAAFPPAGSGVVVPFVLAGRAHGLLVVESTRCGDFGPADVDRLVAFAAREAGGLRAAQFRQWHEERWGDPVALDTRSLACRDLFVADVERVRAAGSLRIVGAPGSGKRTLARWVRFERGVEARDPIRIGDHGLDTPGAVETVLEVAPLADRRDEIPALAEVLATRAAREIDCPPLRWTEDARALLFRQPWPGNVRELGAWVAALTRQAPGATIGRDEVLGLSPDSEWVERLESRPARAHDVRAALTATASPGGGWNKRRAARYLGWDRGTLSAVLARDARSDGRS